MRARIQQGLPLLETALCGLVVDLHEIQGLKRDCGQKCWVETGLSKAGSLCCPSSKAVHDLPVLIQSSVLGLNIVYLGT